MEAINKTLQVNVSAKIAFRRFVDELDECWPKDYTWSQNGLQRIGIEHKENGLCTEIGPHGFRIDWGRVTKIKDAELISLKWKISANRQPIPNPENASDIQVVFIESGSSTTIEFKHFNFQNHGEGHEDYQELMASTQGWDYILDHYQSYCHK